MKGLARLATRVFDTPLMIQPAKAEIILGVLAPKLRGEPVGPMDPMPGEPDDCDMEQRDAIAVIPVHGTLVHRATGLEAMSGLASYVEIGAWLDQAMADPKVKGILLDVDSPGGEVAGVFALAERIFQARARMPVFAVANEAAYSAAYALASGANRIYLSSTAGVGSIGVIAVHRDQSAADKMDGLKYTTIFAGARKNDGNPHEPLTDKARATIQALVDRTYGIFVETVAKHRGISADQVRATEAGIFQGAQAIDARLADQIGTFADALAALEGTIAKNEQPDRRRTRTGPGLTAADPGAEDLPPLGTSAELNPGNGKGDTMPDANKPAATATGAKPADTAQPAATTTTPPASVVDLDAVRGEGEARALAYVARVNELCALADCPHRAADFIAKKVAVEDIGKALLAEKASKTDAGAISSHHQPGKGAEAADHGWSKIVAGIGGSRTGYSPAGLPAGAAR